MTETHDHLHTVDHKMEIEAAAELFGGVGVARPEIEEAVRELLTAVGEDPWRGR